MMLRLGVMAMILGVGALSQGVPWWLAAGRAPAVSYQAELTYTAPGHLEGDGWDGGDVDLFAARAGASWRQPAGSSTWMTLGAGWEGTWFDVPSGAPLPGALTALALRTGFQWNPAEKWSVLLEARPGVFSDLEDVGWEDVNVPLLLGGSYEVSTNLVVVLGVNVNWWSRLATIGGPGVVWRFADEWRLSLVLPRPSVDWTPSRGWTVFAGGEIRGGGWRVAEDFGQRHGDAELDGDVLGYREIRAGVGLRRSMGPVLRLTVEGGYAVSRRFEFREAERDLDVGSAPYIQCGVAGAF